MAGLFSAPEPAAPIFTPLPPVVDVASEEEQQRKERLRRQRSRSATIATSARGVLQARVADAAGKRRLGD